MVIYLLGPFRSLFFQSVESTLANGIIGVGNLRGDYFPIDCIFIQIKQKLILFLSPAFLVTCFAHSLNLLSKYIKINFYFYLSLLVLRLLFFTFVLDFDNWCIYLSKIHVGVEVDTVWRV